MFGFGKKEGAGVAEVGEGEKEDLLTPEDLEKPETYNTAIMELKRQIGPMVLRLNDLRAKAGRFDPAGTADLQLRAEELIQRLNETIDEEFKPLV